MRRPYKPLETATAVSQQAVQGFFTVRLYGQGLNRPGGGGKQKTFRMGSNQIKCSDLLNKVIRCPRSRSLGRWI